MPDSLRTLIERAQAKDRSALNELAGCADRFVRIFHGALSDRLRRSYGSTLDFVLEGLSEALSRLEEFEYQSDPQFYAWVASYIRGRIADAGRKEGRIKRAAGAQPVGDADGNIAGDDPTASAIVGDGEIREIVGRALLEQQLEHPAEMEVVVLKLFDGRSWPYIRELLSLSSEKRARTLYAQGLDYLRPRVEERLGSDQFASFVHGRR